MPVIQGFPPIVGDSPKILILGTMPSVASLTHQEYYANPQNLFWRIIGGYVDCLHDSSYETRKQALKKAGVAVWDVLKRCKREGSLDSRIEKEVPNDVVAFLEEYPTIVRIGLNGRKAEKLFMQYIAPNVKNMECLQYFDLPSTSPANASISMEVKRERWAKLFEGI